MHNIRLRIAGGLLLITGLTAGLILPGHAIETARLSLGSIAGEDWAINELVLSLYLKHDTGLHAELVARSARLPEQLGRVEALQAVCDAVELTAGQIECNRGTIRLNSSRLGRQSLPFTARYRYPDGALQLQLQNISVAGGRVALTVTYHDGDWAATVSTKDLGAADLADELEAAGVVLPSLAFQGVVDLDCGLQGRAGQPLSVDFDGRLQLDSFSDEAGRYAGENLSAVFNGSARFRSESWEVHADIGVDQGAVYLEPVYVEVADAPVTATLVMALEPGKRRLDLNSFDYRHPGTLRASGRGYLDLDHAQPVRQLQVALQEVVFPSAYETYVQPWLTGSLAGNLKTAGAASGSVQIDGGSIKQFGAGLQSLSIQERGGLFGFDKLSGNINWNDSAALTNSTFGWESGHVYRVSLGQTALEIASTGNSVRLSKPVRIPVLDGALDVETFHLEYPQEKTLHWEIDSILTPVSMQQLTRALDWPEFGGKLSGVIPDVSYTNGQLAVGGVLLVRVFDGVVTLRDLMLTEPFGLVPRLQVNANIDNIDLEALTGAFSFGRIEGRLDGRVDGLLLESWLPVSFDAEFATPEDDRSRHRISQKAVDNISNIGGGGVGGALSRSFLRFFEDFPYDRLGIRCRLRNGICDMGGVEPADNGYYLVKGRFLPPRLDVVGFADRVDWDSLVAQIIAVTREQEVRVE